MRTCPVYRGNITADKNEFSTSSLSKVIVLHPDIQTDATGNIDEINLANFVNLRSSVWSRSWADEDWCWRWCDGGSELRRRRQSTLDRPGHLTRRQRTTGVAPVYLQIHRDAGEVWAGGTASRSTVEVFVAVVSWQCAAQGTELPRSSRRRLGRCSAARIGPDRENPEVDHRSDDLREAVPVPEAETGVGGGKQGREPAGGLIVGWRSTGTCRWCAGQSK